MYQINYIITNNSCSYTADFFLLFGKGIQASSDAGLHVLAPLQLPLTGGRQKEFTTLRACAFWKYSFVFGWSLVPPLCRWHPKKFSTGSWQRFMLKNESLLSLTCFRLYRYLTRPMNGFATVQYTGN